MYQERIRLCALPTPLENYPRLDEYLGFECWIKRDDLTESASGGNKIRKLEFLLADAIKQGATTIITCGGVQSNHARATALMSARLGLRCELFLRSDESAAIPTYSEGNLLLDRLSGAQLHFITPSDYQKRSSLMSQRAHQLEQAYIVPEGGSNALGSIAYRKAIEEISLQVDPAIHHNSINTTIQPSPPKHFKAIAVACGSGGTAAGLLDGLTSYPLAEELWAFAVCDDAPYFEAIFHRINGERISDNEPRPFSPKLKIFDQYVGQGYGQSCPAQRSFMLEVCNRTGIVLDPVYSGKGMYGLFESMKDQSFTGATKNQAILFVHTGGLPGLLAQHPNFTEL